MPYGPHTAGDRERMLAALGIASVDELFADIPRGPPGEPARPARSPSPSSSSPPASRAWPAGTGPTSPRSSAPASIATGPRPAVDQLLLRGEWYTAYTPYQPEISQGTLQSIYEYESLIAELVDLDVVSASHYDGAAATAEAALMTCRATRRERVLVSARGPSALPPDARDLLRRRARARRRSRSSPRATPPGRPTSRRWSGCSADGDAGRRRRSRPSRASSACSSRWPRSAGSPTPPGALFVSVIEPVSLAVLAPPGAYGADIAAGEGQPLGIPPQYGGPYLGILASTDGARPPDPRPPRRDDDRRPRPAGLRDDAPRARAGHPARQGGQQHLHEPGAARPRRQHLSRDDRAARAARRRRPGRRPRRPPRGRPGRGRCAARPSRARTSTSSRSASRTPGRSIAG